MSERTGIFRTAPRRPQRRHGGSSAVTPWHILVASFASVLFCPAAATAAGWGDQNWGELVWGFSVPVPALPDAALRVLAIAVLLLGVLLVRMRRPSR